MGFRLNREYFGRLLLLAAALAAGAGCGRGLIATLGPDYQGVESGVAADWRPAPPEAALERDTAPKDAADWWRRFNDPLLIKLLAAADAASGSVAQAQARIASARADLTGAVAAGLPAVDGNFGAGSTAFSFGGPVYNRNQFFIGAQTSWEIDLFGGLARQREADVSRLAARQADWRAARAAAAAETANAYLAFRHCERLRELAAMDASARRNAAGLVATAAGFGLRSAADAALSRASAADGESLCLQRGLQCDQAIKALATLTAVDESRLRNWLTESAGLPEPPPLALPAMPAELLLRRPDVAAAERAVAEAGALVGVAEAARYPRLTLTGSIQYAIQNISPSPLALAQTWSVGPTISLPIFDAGKRAANQAAAEVQYRAAETAFRQSARQAVREVEEALLRIHAAVDRLPQARIATEGYRRNVAASEELYRAGLGSLLSVEENRRSAIAAETALAELRQERVAAWIALYRATGGGWRNEEWECCQ